MALSYAFDASRETPETLARRRENRDVLAARIFSRAPQNVGEGLNLLGQALTLRWMDDDIRKAQAAGNASVPGWLSGGADATSPPPAVSAPGSTSSAPPMGGMPAFTNASNRIYSNDEPSPLDPPGGADLDRMARTVVAEAGNQGPVGMNAVASNIRTRAVDGGYGGNTPSQVVMAPKQYEPWNTEAGRNRMASIDPNGPAYQGAVQAIDSAYKGNDPTGGATHFYSPTAQAAMGRPAPRWDNGKGIDIGQHRFFGGAQTAQSDQSAMPPHAQPAQGMLPTQEQVRGGSGSGGHLASRSTDELTRALVNPFAAPYRPAIEMELKYREANNKTGTMDLGDRVAITDRQGNVIREHRKGEPVKGADFGIIGQDEYGNNRYGWRDPRTQTEKPAAAPTGLVGQSVIPPVPNGIDPKVHREAYSKRYTEDNMPGSYADSTKLRGEVQQLPSYKNLAQAAPVYKSMFEAAGRDTRAADVNMIYGMAKVMDPGSVVRESEMTIAQAIATLPEQLKATVSSQLQGSGRLTPEVRAAIMQEARSRVQAYKGMFDQDAGMYRGIATRGRMNVDDVLPTFGEFEEFKPAQAASAAPSNGGVRRFNPTTGRIE